MVELEYLKKEIVDTNQQMIHGVFLFAILMVISYIGAVVTSKIELYQLVLVFAVSTSFWIAREDYLIHRAGAYIAKTEITQEAVGWENHKAGLKSRFLMFPLDLFAALSLLWIVWMSAQNLFLLGQGRFVIVMITGIVSGIMMTIIMQLLAKAHW